MTHSETLSERVVVESVNACDYCGFPELEVISVTGSGVCVWCQNCERYATLDGHHRLWLAAFAEWTYADFHRKDV